VYGIKAPWSEQFVDDYDDVYEKCPVNLVMDGYGADYIIFGKHLFASPNFRWDADGGDSMTFTEVSDFPKIEQEYRAEFAKWFPQHTALLDAPFKLITFTHYS
jgi:hypothetical protein